MLDALDILKIHQLLAQYGHAIDAADWDLFESLFVEDAAIDYRSTSGEVQHSTRSDIVAWFRSVSHPAAHHVTNIVVDHSADADGRVHVHSKFIAPYSRPVHQPKRLFGGDYHDVVVRTPDGWKFAWKQCIPRWNVAVTVDDAAEMHRRTF